MSNKVRRILIFVLAIVLLLCICVMAYPYLSALYSESVRSEVQIQYNEAIQDSNEEEIAAILEAARDYNRKLFSGEIDLLNPGNYGYYEQLKMPYTDVIAYVRIPRLDLELPIYHGIGDDALSRGCGHMPQTSLPVGGENTHAVISAHTGMAESPMFSELERMVEGDIFQIEVLGQVLTYQVEIGGIQTVLPEDISSIKLERGRDLVTLITCTPFGVNTHRLLVRGVRIETPAEFPVETAPTEILENESTVWRSQYARSVCIGLSIAGSCILLILAITLYRRYIRKKRGNSK